MNIRPLFRPDVFQTTTVDTPDGPFTVLSDANDVVYASGWTDDAEQLRAQVSPMFRAPELTQTDGGAPTDAVLAYYDGDLGALRDVAVCQLSGPFVMQAWDALRTVQPGSRVTYGRLAELAGNAKAVRGAAQCCVFNVAVLFVPCHRVVRSNGTLGGYRYGLELKQTLLEREAELSAPAPA